jgi:hypothetical protein
MRMGNAALLKNLLMKGVFPVRPDGQAYHRPIDRSGAFP